MFHRKSTDLGTMYEKYADAMFRVAMTYMQNTNDAEDAVHDAFVKYAEVRPVFSSEEYGRAWMLRVTINKCRDMLRRRRIRQYMPLEAAGNVAAVENPEYSVLMESLKKLPDKLRIVIILHYLEGLSVEETGKALRISVSAVKMRLLRGRNALRELVDKEE